MMVAHIEREGTAMKVEGILKAKGAAVETVRPDTSVVVAIHKLSSLGIGALVVSADGKGVDGIFAERDVVHGLARHGARLLDLVVSDAMSRTVPVCAPTDSITAVMAVMTRTRNRHMPVVSGGSLVGLVSIGDLVKNRLDEMELEASILREAYIVGR
ncbi:MAG: CBS domain-containing protein [Acidimicrobiales bacterium]